MSTPNLERNRTTTEQRGNGRWINHWDPEDTEFWNRTGKRVAWRNLWLSVLAEHLGFNVWTLMSIVVVSLDDVGYSFTVGQTFWLLILPNLVGAALRIPYTFAIPRFGGRGWTTTSASLLLIPCAMLAGAVTFDGTPYWFFLLTAAAMGLGGGNFSSSMTNISFFFPERRKGLALGINAAGGNIGVAVSQLLVPFAIHLGTGVNLSYAALMWMPVIIVSAVCSWSFMNSLTVAKPDNTSYRKAVTSKHTPVMALLYIGSFGSFIGFSFAFPSLIGIVFSEFSDFTGIAFVGALIGSVARPFGGWLSDRLGGARITFWNFVALALGTLGALLGVRAENFTVFFTSFVLLFVLTGIGNGSTYRMIPLIFKVETSERVKRTGEDEDLAQKAAKRQSGAVVGIVGSIGAFGGVVINLVFKFSLQASGTLVPALVAILVFFLACVLTTWWFYVRSRFAIERFPNLAHAHI
ncbi:MFS transporter [Actinopolyspora erythraea]|uniref:MFS transporter n=1 Tax=Actinopolyspora erythraea TaxID=414996 RepID=A0A099D6B9_9ACTN|nr:MFS transporter [Actinopolyspora erythraea]ASU78773.1 MFS transporter [Actinopolyspora erythraea]KGI81524.1 nitrate transporter [Actinopolyspora erythraea]